MYCKRADSNAGYMTTFSYCPDDLNQKCIMNYWLFINAPQICLKNAIDGWNLDIDEDCKSKAAQASVCPTTFVSDPEKIGTTVAPRSVVLGENTRCTIEVDATDAVARITFKGDKSLGVL